MKKTLTILAYLLILIVPYVSYLYIKTNKVEVDTRIVKEIIVCSKSDWDNGECEHEDGILSQESQDIVVLVKLNRSKTSSIDINIGYDKDNILTKSYNYWDIGDNSELVLVLERDLKNNWLLGEYDIVLQAKGSLEEKHFQTFYISN